jgi:hypothetical protein
MNKLRKNLYNISKVINKTASILGDIEAITSGSPKKVVKRMSNKTKNKMIYKTANKISRKVTKK